MNITYKALIEMKNDRESDIKWKTQWIEEKEVEIERWKQDIKEAEKDLEAIKEMLPKVS